MLRLAASAGCSVRTSDREITFAVGETYITTSLILDAFPDWRIAFPSSPLHQLTFDRRGLLQALQRLAVIASRADLGTVLISQGGDDRLVLRARVPDIGEQEDHVAGTMTMDAVAFGRAFLADLAAACHEDSMTLRADSPHKVFSVEEADFRALLTPIEARR